MAKVAVYTNKGAKKEDMNLPKGLVGDINPSLLAQSLRVYEDRMHSVLAVSKTRSQINASKKKIYRQKGTGGARHGARSAPIFAGGGTAHGPKGVKRQLSMSKKMKKLALLSAISAHSGSNLMAVIDGISSIQKTKEAGSMIKKIRENAKVAGNKLVVVLSADNKDILRYFRNIKDVDPVLFSDLNARKVIKSSMLLIDKKALDAQPTVKTAKSTEKAVSSNKADKAKPARKQKSKKAKPAAATKAKSVAAKRRKAGK